MLEFLFYVATVGAIYGILAVSLNLQAGVAGLLNFGQVAFFGIGAYGVGIAAHRGAPILVGVLCAIAVAALAGAAIGRLGRTLSAEYWAIATLALAELFRVVILNEDWIGRGADGIGGIPGLWGALSGTARDVVTLATAVVILVALYLIGERITTVQFGRVARLIREQPGLAASMGHDVVKTKVRMMMIGAVFASIAGALFTSYISFIGPGQLLPFSTFLVWATIVVGGLGNHRGAIVGAFVIQLIYSGSRFVNDYLSFPPESAASLRLLLVGLTLLAFLLFRTDGLVPERLRGEHAERG